MSQLSPERLGDLCEVVRGASPRPKGDPRYFGGSIPWVLISDVTSARSRVLQRTKEFVTEAGRDRSRLVGVGQLIVSNSATVGLPIFMGVEGCIHDGFLTFLKVDPRLSLRWLYWYFHFARGELARIAPEGTQKNLNTEIVENIRLSLPSIGEQLRVATLLDRADDLRRTRRYARQLCDEFLPAAFLQMFGDPRTNPNSHPRASIEELGKVETGNTPPRELKDYFGNHVEWIKSDNISLSELHPNRAVEGLSARGEQVGTVVGPDSLLVTCIAGSVASIGNVVLTDRRVAFNQQINSITPHEDVDPLFLYALMLVAKPMVQAGATEAMKKMITKSKLEELVLFKPPFQKQRQFAKIVTRWSAMRQTNRESFRQTDHLFQTLLHQAFNLPGN